MMRDLLGLCISNGGRNLLLLLLLLSFMSVGDKSLMMIMSEDDKRMHEVRESEGARENRNGRRFFAFAVVVV